MTAPTTKLLWCAALLVLPFCALPGFFPAAALPCLLFLLLCLALSIFDAVRAHRRLQPLRITAIPSMKAFKGRAAILPLHIAGASQAGRLTLTLTVPPQISAAPVFIESRAAPDISVPFTPEERGSFHLASCSVNALSPWKLWRIGAPKPLATEIRVFPDLVRDAAAKLLLAARTGGLRQQRLVGRGREFERLREYSAGDVYDEISWKATARRRRPVVKVFQIERTQDVYAVIDSSRLSARRNAAELFVTAALTLALAVENAGDNFGLLTFSDHVDRFLPASRGARHFARCRDAIYDLAPSRVSPDFAELIAFLQLRVRRRALLLFLTDLSDPILAETFAQNAPLLARRHIVALNPLSSDAAQPLFSGDLPQSRQQIVERLAGHIQWSRQRDLEKKLNHLGIRVSSLLPASASLDLVNCYRNVKRRQLL